MWIQGTSYGYKGFFKLERDLALSSFNFATCSLIWILIPYKIVLTIEIIVHVQGQENYPVAGILRVLFVGDLLGVGFPGVDLILPCLTVTLTSTQVLPTDGANCRDWV